MRIRLALIAVAVLACAAVQAAGRWTDHLMPLPKRCQLGRALPPASGALVLHLPRADEPVVEQIADEWKELLGRRPGLSVVRDRPDWQMVLGGRGDGPADERALRGTRANLARLPNSDQAYKLEIAARGGHWVARVVALGPAGLYYGHKTLRQLAIATTRRHHRPARRFYLPAGVIVDWPDMPERGEWGGYALRDMQWMAELKMNLIEDHARLGFEADGTPTAQYSRENIEKARRYAIKLVPIITHLDQLEGRGIFKHYPHLVAKGGPEGWTNWGRLLRPVCWAEPDAVRIMTKWMEELARQEGVSAITVWLSEAYGQCKCPVCSKTNQYVMETRAALAAWRAARRIKPGLQLRILLTQGSYKYNESVLREIPIGENVGVIYYHGSLTYNPFKREMIEPYMVEFVRRGGWFGVCPTLSASWRIVSPFSSPQFVQTRMREFVGKGLKCLYGYATPGNEWWRMNVAAAAEWTWNARGRSVAEFARAWAVRRDIEDAEAAMKWVLLVGPVSWDIYASKVPYPWFFGSLGARLKKHALVKFGEGPLQEIKSAREFAQHMRRCRQALSLAEKIGQADMVAETRAIIGYLQVLDGARQISEVLARAGNKGEKLSEADRERLRELMGRLDEAGRQLTEALWAWARAVALKEGQRPPRRFKDTVNVVDQTITAIGEACEAVGVKDPGRAYRWREIGRWKTEDFDEQSPVTKRIDVTGAIDGAGTYEVRFQYTSGLLGLVVTKVRLLSRGPGGDEAVEAVDEHRCHAGAWAEGEVYRLKLERWREGRRYFAEITMGAGHPDQPRERRSSNGVIYMRKLRPDGGEQGSR